MWPGARSFEMRNLAKIADAGGSSGLARLRRVRWKLLPQRTPPRRTHGYSHRRSRTPPVADGITVEKIPVADLVRADCGRRHQCPSLRRPRHTAHPPGHPRLGVPPRGPSLPRSLVAMNSGWDTRAGAGGAFTNRDALGVQHTPGFNPEAIDFLVRERNIVAVGSDTLSIDRGPKHHPRGSPKRFGPQESTQSKPSQICPHFRPSAPR